MEPQRFESLYPPDSRFAEVEKILSFVKNGNSSQVISLPGVGRSNILRLIAYNSKCRQLHLGENQAQFHFVMMNFSEMKKRPLKDATKYIFLELMESLANRKMEEEHKTVKKLFDESLKGGDELVFFQGLKKSIDYLCLEKDMNIILLFDRFEDYVPMLESTFFDNLRILRDRAKYKFSAVFPLNRPLEEILGPEIISSYYEFVVGNIVYLSLGDSKITQFRKKYLEKNTGKKIKESVATEIMELTGGLGKLWLVSTEKALESGEENITAEFLLSSNRVKAVLSEIWNSFSPFEQNLIQTGKSNESSHLVAVGLIKDNKFAVPILEAFAKEQTSKIEKVDLDTVSNQLTSSEFKLLKFLMENPEKIVERDEIVEAVWGELASTSGVTEQALDQLVFRLRKKIEENPNLPTHILTVKGRGFKFLA